MRLQALHHRRGRDGLQVLAASLENTGRNDDDDDLYAFVFTVLRAMLLKRKKKQKKVVVKTYEWIEKPIDITIQQGKADEAIFTAKFSDPEKKGKWYLRNNVSPIGIVISYNTYILNDQSIFGGLCFRIRIKTCDLRNMVWSVLKLHECHFE